VEDSGEWSVFMGGVVISAGEREIHIKPYIPNHISTYTPYPSNHRKWFGIIHAKPWFVKSFICMKNCQIIGNNSNKFVISFKKFYNVLKNQKTRKHGLILTYRGFCDEVRNLF